MNVGDAQVAYQVTSDGPIDLVYMLGIGSNIEMWWEYAPSARSIERLASFSRLIMFDRRGNGASDSVPLETIGTWEHYQEDLETVMNAAGSDEAVIVAGFDSGPVALLFAAAHPERVRGLVLLETYARGHWAEDYPIGTKDEVWEATVDVLIKSWGTTEFATMFNDSQSAADADLIARMLRTSATPRSAAAQMEYQRYVDARNALPLIQAPTLVMNSGSMPLIPASMGRYMAERIPNATFVDLTGSPVGPLILASDDAIDHVEEFVTGTRPTAAPTRQLSTVVFTDIVGSTEQLAIAGDQRWREMLEHHAHTARALIATYGGRMVKSTGDGILATFDLPGKAIGFATELSALSPIPIRAGIHSGEIELMADGDIGGLAVHIAQRVESAAEPGTVYCTRTVKDLTAGSRLVLEDRGVHKLKGVPDDWRLFAVKV